MALSQNGWPVLATDSAYLHRWTIPTAKGAVHVTLRRGSAGFLLCHMALWLNDVVEPLVGGTADEWGYAYRTVRGSTTVWSNHASGTALDLNAVQHPIGVAGTFTRTEATSIRTRLKVYGGALAWGGDYTTRPDEMHFELARPLVEAQLVARSLLDTPRGKVIIGANPLQKALILG